VATPVPRPARTGRTPCAGRSAGPLTAAGTAATRRSECASVECGGWRADCGRHRQDGARDCLFYPEAGRCRPSGHRSRSRCVRNAPAAPAAWRTPPSAIFVSVIRPRKGDMRTTCRRSPCPSAGYGGSRRAAVGRLGGRPPGPGAGPAAERPDGRRPPTKISQRCQIIVIINGPCWQPGGFPRPGRSCGVAESARSRSWATLPTFLTGVDVPGRRPASDGIVPGWTGYPRWWGAKGGVGWKCGGSFAPRAVRTAGPPHRRARHSPS
jgi:hypothetical protein